MIIPARSLASVPEPIGMPSHGILHRWLYSSKFIYSEKATKFCEISAVDLLYVVTVKSAVEILQNFVCFSKYMNFTSVRKKESRFPRLKFSVSIA